MRGEAQGTALNSQRSWIAEQLKDTDRNLGRAASFSSSFDGSNERAGHEDVHPAVAIVAAQGHYYDQMMKLPFELLSSQIVSEEIAGWRLCCKPVRLIFEDVNRRTLAIISHGVRIPTARPRR